MKIESFGATERKIIAAEMLAATQAIAEKYGLTAEQKGGSYDSTTFTPKFVFVLPAANAAKKEQEAALYGPMLGLPADIVGKTFHDGAKTFTVVGLNPSRPKNCVELKDQNGVGFKCGAQYVLRRLGK